MSSSNYSSYNYPYHQQSSSYQPAPASNTNAQSSRQYQQAPSAATNQPADYLSYSGPSYDTSGAGYSTAQDNTWSGSSNSYGTTRDNSRGATEVLRDMSKIGYAATRATPSQPGFTATNAAFAHYKSGSSPQVQAPPLHNTHTAYGLTQARPRGVNTDRAQASATRRLSSPATVAGYPSQRQPQYQQRTASPVQPQYSHNNATAASRNAAIATAVTSQQYNDYNRPVDTLRFTHSVVPSTSYTPRPPAPIGPSSVASVSEPYTGSSTTVDPTAVYDPWPEIQPQQAIRVTERAGSDRKEEEARKEEERIEEDGKQKEAEEEARQAQIAASQPEPRAEKARKQHAAAPTEAPGASAAGSDLEAEIRAVMAKMRELNGKDPLLLARIWEEERRAKTPGNKPPTVMTKPAPQPAIATPTQVPTPPVANQRKKATPRESLSMPGARAVTPVQTQAVPSRVAAATPVRTGGNTIWPPEKKLELAKAAVHYLATKNPDHPLEIGQILQMLNSNPSYVELCEQLEQMGFKLDRSIFAKSLLLAVPDVYSASRNAAQPIPPATALKAPAPPAVMKGPTPPAVMKNPVTTLIASNPRYARALASPTDRSPYPPLPDGDAMAAPSPRAVAKTILISPQSKPPVNKEEAARKRNLSELIDLTKLEDDDMVPPMKRFNANSMDKHGLPHPHIDDAMEVDAAPVNNFPTASIPASITTVDEPTPRTMPVPASELRYRAIVEPLDRKKALRRNTYNPATIARDILLACGRHPTERQLNQHLDVLKLHLPQITNESDLSTIKWNYIDPGNPPPGYFKNSVQALTEDADDEDNSEDEDRNRAARWESSSQATGGESVRVQALPEATNPFIKQKRHGQPPRHSVPNTTTPATPNRQISPANMSVSAPPPSAAVGVGYSAFRSATEFGPDGEPVTKKKGRPFGWRKAIHGSAAAQQRPGMNGHTGKFDPQQPSTLRKVNNGDNEPIRIDSRSPSVANRVPQYQSFKCKWQNCKAELHNLETLKKHVFKVHKKETLRNTLECMWDDCGREITSFDPMTNMSIERHMFHAFGAEDAWREHIQQNHFDPLAWEQGDGPAGGLSDAHDSEAYLSDAQGRRVTPRITASHASLDDAAVLSYNSTFTSHGRGRPPKNAQEQEARETQARLVLQKRRMGGLGMDRGGATLVNDKRRRGLVDNDGTEEELVDAED